MHRFVSDTILNNSLITLDHTWPSAHKGVQWKRTHFVTKESIIGNILQDWWVFVFIQMNLLLRWRLTQKLTQRPHHSGSCKTICPSTRPHRGCDCNLITAQSDNVNSSNYYTKQKATERTESSTACGRYCKFSFNSQIKLSQVDCHLTVQFTNPNILNPTNYAGFRT